MSRHTNVRRFGRSSVKRDKVSVVVSGIVGFSGSLLDDDSFGIAPAASYVGIDIILPIDASWKPSLSVLKVTAPDEARQRSPTTLFELFEQVVGFLGRCREREWSLNVAWCVENGVEIQRSVADVGSGNGDQGYQAERAQQADEKTDEPSPSKSEHRLFFPWQKLNRKTTVAFSF